MSRFASQQLLSAASRNRFVSNLKQLRIPQQLSAPKKQAAVLVPLCNIDDEVSILYTLRSINLKHNSGQVSFPGGKADRDESPIETALRETYEEIGLERSRVDVWSEAPGVPNVSNTIFITPVIGTVKSLNADDLNVNVDEVAEVFSISVEALCNPKHQFHTQFRNGFLLPVFQIQDYRIWGVTAYITHLVLNCLCSSDLYNNHWVKKRVAMVE